MKKPFDLQKALAGEPWEHKLNRGDSPMRDQWQIIGRSRAKALVVAQNKLGTFIELREEDLFMLPKITTVWANVYRRKSTGMLEVGASGLHADEKSARAKASLHSPEFDFIDTIKIEVEE